MARAIVYSEIGTPDVLHLTEIPDPVAGPGEVVVRIDAVGVNPLDAKLRRGARPSPPITEPRRVGFDGAGTVTQVGADVTGFAVGDRVAINNVLGTYATALAVPATALFRLTDGVTMAEGAGLGIPIGTAYQCMRSLNVGQGDTLLVHAGSGAVGQAAVQYAKLWGATVIATGSPERFDHLREIGAIPVAYGEGLADRVRELAPQGVTVALDCIGTDEAIEVSKQLVADHDRIATIVRGPDAAELGIRAFSGGSPIPLTINVIEAGDFQIELGPELPLAEAARAHELIERHAARGKIVLIP